MESAEHHEAGSMYRHGGEIERMKLTLQEATALLSFKKKSLQSSFVESGKA